MRKNLNTVKIRGRVYQHELAVKTVQNEQSENFGKAFINGRLDVATDEAGMNIVQIFYTYVTPTTKSGSANATYGALKKIIDENKTWVEVGKDEAIKVKVDSNIAVNDWYNTQDELVSTVRIEGGFVTIVSNLDEKCSATFKTDIVLTRANIVEATEENHLKEDFLSLSGYVFNFRNDVIPCSFCVKDKGGIKHFENMEIASNKPVYTQIWGNVVSTFEEVKTVTESAFGEDAVDSYERRVREWVVTGTHKVVPYDFGEEEYITAAELKKALQNREVHLAEVKKRRDEYQASKAGVAAPTVKADDDFNF